MPATIRSKMFLMIILLMTATTIVIILTTRNNLEKELTGLYRSLAKNRLQSVGLLLEKQSDELISDELESIARRRELMENMSSALIVYITETYQLAKTGYISEKKAQKKVLDRISRMRYGNHQYFFICDMNLRGLAHPLQAMIGEKWTGHPNVEQRDAFAAVRDYIREEKTAYTVFQWPSLADQIPVKQLGFFTYFPQWEWIIGTTARISDLEKESRQKREEMMAELKTLFPKMENDEAEGLFLCNGNGRLLIQPEYSEREMPDTAFVSGLMASAEHPETPFVYACAPAGKPRHNHIMYVRYFKMLDWYAGVSISLDAVSEPTNRLTLKQTYILLILLFTGLLIASLLSEKIVRPLVHLARYARDLPAKNFVKEETRPPQVSSNSSEIHELENAFTFMDAELDKQIMAMTHHQEHLEDLVNARTSDLTRTNAELHKEISERKLTQKSLQESEAQKTAILNGITINIAFVNRNLEILWVNKAAANSVNKKPEEMIGGRCYQFWGDTEKPCPNCPTFRAFQSRKSEHITVVTPDGRIWDEKGEPVFDSEGDLIGIVEIAEDITDRKRAEEAIRNALDEKEILLREIHHRVKNNMQMIISLLRMHSRKNQSPHIKTVFDDCRGRVEAMSLIHESLYQSDRLEHINFKTYLKKLCRNLGRVYNTGGEGVFVSADHCQVALNMDKSIAVGMVMAELISNAYKHAFPPGRDGKVEVRLRAFDPETVEVTVADDGKGLPPDFDVAKSQTLGMRLVWGAVTRELGGAIKAVNDGGAKFIVRFKGDSNHT